MGDIAQRCGATAAGRIAREGRTRCGGAADAITLPCRTTNSRARAGGRLGRIPRPQHHRVAVAADRMQALRHRRVAIAVRPFGHRFVRQQRLELAP
jgi:hypothetical protein